MMFEAKNPNNKVQFSIFHLAILSLCGFVTSFGAHIVATNLPSYAETVGVGTFMIGLLIGVYDFAELFAKPLAGLLADRKGMKLSLLGGLLVFILGSLLFLVIPVNLLLLVRFVQGLGAAALSTVSITLVAKYFTKKRGRAFGIYNAIKGLGYVIAPVLGGYLVKVSGFQLIFIFSAGVGLVALLLSLTLPKDREKSELLDDDDDDLSVKEFFLIFKDRALLPIYAVIMTNMFLVGILFGFLPVYLHSIGKTPLESGFVVSIATLSYIAIQPFAGYVSEKLPAALIVVVGLVLSSLGVIAVPFLQGVPLIAVVVISGIGVGTVWTNTDVLVGSMVHESRLGSGMGAAQSFKELGDMLGPILIGLLTQSFGLKVGFSVCGILALLSLIGFYFSFRSWRVEIK